MNVRQIANELKLGFDYMLFGESKMDKELRPKGMGPRLHPQQIEKIIIKEEYHHFAETTMTVCCLKLRNGHSVIGKSACIAPENFEADLGMKYAREDAVKNALDLEAYLISQRLFTFGE